MTFDEVCSHFAARGQVRANGNDAVLAGCPVCGGGVGHLSIKRGNNGGVLLACARCDAKAPAIVDAVGLTMQDIAPPREERQQSRIVATYDYTDSNGSPLYQVVRFDPKDFRQRRRDDSQQTGWSWNLRGVPLVLYRLPEVLSAVERGQQVVVVEGEKDADRLARHGIVATTACMGAGKWSKGGKAYTDPLRGADVLIIADRDPDSKEGKPHRAGQRHAAEIAESLRGVASRVAVLELRIVNGSERPLKDASDWFDEGGTAAELLDEAKRHAVDGQVYARLQREWYAESCGQATPQKAAQAPAVAVDNLDDSDTDLAASHRLRAMFGDRIRYCGQRNTWFVWDGRRWKRDDGLQVERLAGEAARAHTVSRLGKDAKQLAAAARLEARPRIVGAVQQARSLEGIAVSAADLDAIPHLLNCRNGTVDLRTGDLMPHDRAHLLTHLVDVDFDPQADAPRFRQFLREIHPDLPDTTEFLRRWMGYSLTGETREHKLVLAVGEGRNGKGVLFEGVARILGLDIAAPAPRGLLMQRKHEPHPTELQALRGRRYIYASEIDGGQTFSEERLKWLTGGDTIAARGMGENFAGNEFTPTHKFAIYVNDLPDVHDSSTAFWERIRVIRFGEKFVGERQDKTLPAKLQAEAAGILAWCVSGAVDWYATGLTEPREVVAASAEYREDKDGVRRWIEDYLTDPTADREQTAKSHFEAYTRWAENNGARTMSSVTFASELTRHKATKVRTKRGVMWTLPTAAEVRLAGVGCRVVQGFPGETRSRADSDLYGQPYTTLHQHEENGAQVAATTSETSGVGLVNGTDTSADDAGDPWGQGWRT